MSAQPTYEEDPQDPQVILRTLPQRERETFLRQYRSALDDAREVAGYRKLQEFLHAWSLRAFAVNQPGYYERMEQAENRDEHPELFTTSFDEIVPDWADRVERARQSRR